MPFNKTRTAATYAKEILRNVGGAEIAENSVVDGTTVPLNGDGRRFLDTGTIMVWIGAVGSSKVKPITGAGVATSAQIAGIVMHSTEFWPDATLEADKDDASVALFTKNCHFASDKLTGYTGNTVAIRAAMTGAGNDRCGNCTFSS